jgi:ATP-dependent 26S proteasome regulatory subunit
LAKKPHHQGLFLRGQIRKRRAARAKAKAKQAQNKKEKLKQSKQSKSKKKNKKKEQKKKLHKQKTQQTVEESVKNYRRQGIGVLLVQQQMDRARRLDNAKFPGNLIFSNENDICRLKIENCKDVSWSKVREAAHPYLKVTFLGCQGRPTSLDSF